MGKSPSISISKLKVYLRIDLVKKYWYCENIWIIRKRLYKMSYTVYHPFAHLPGIHINTLRIWLVIIFFCQFLFCSTNTSIYRQIVQFWHIVQLRLIFQYIHILEFRLFRNYPTIEAYYTVIVNICCICQCKM